MFLFYLSIFLSSQNLKPTWPTMQLPHQGFDQRWSCVIPVTSNSLDPADVSSPSDTFPTWSRQRGQRTLVSRLRQETLTSFPPFMFIFSITPDGEHQHSYSNETITSRCSVYKMFPDKCLIIFKVVIESLTFRMETNMKPTRSRSSPSELQRFCPACD